MCSFNQNKRTTTFILITHFRFLNFKTFLKTFLENLQTYRNKFAILLRKLMKFTNVHNASYLNTVSLIIARGIYKICHWDG